MARWFLRLANKKLRKLAERHVHNRNSIFALLNLEVSVSVCSAIGYLTPTSLVGASNDVFQAFPVLMPSVCVKPIERPPQAAFLVDGGYMEN